MSKKQDLSQKHQVENEKLESIFKSEMNELESKYQKFFNDLEEKSKIMEEKLNEKHQNEMEELYNFLDTKLPKNIKHSKKFLDLKNMELNLAKQQKYKEAQRIKKQCEDIEKLDSEKFNREISDKIKSQSIKTANRHLNEKNSFKKRIELEWEEAKKKKDSEVQVIVLRYKNRKSELENQQKSEVLLCENKNKMKALTMTGKYKNKEYLFNTSYMQNYNTNDDNDYK